MWRLYKSLRFQWGVWGTFIIGGLGLALAGDCLSGWLFEGKSCTLNQAVRNSLPTYGPWVLGLFLLLLGLTYWARQDYRRHKARENFALFSSTIELSPEDLNFRVIEPGEDTPQFGRPFNEAIYVSRTAAPYDQRGQENPQPQYDETSLVRSVQENNDFLGFLLLGPPLDGKSRTLYEIAKRMESYLVVRPDPYEKVPDDEDFSLLLKDEKVVLLLDDLTKYAQEETLNLRAFVESLREHASSWGVASTCRDGPDLSSVKDSNKESLRWFYDKIPLKLFLVEASAEDKRRLAESVGRGRDAHSWEEFPSLGQIVMEAPMRDMRTRFERLSYEQQDILRGLKLVADAGIPTLTRDRLKAVLENESPFDRQGIHLGDQLRLLVEQSFLQSVSRDRVQPEPAYLRYVVTYEPGRTLLEDFVALTDLLKSLRDYEGLYYVGTTYGANYAQYEEALQAFEAALQIRPDEARILSNKGNALSGLGRPEEAIEAFDEALQIQPDYADALYNKVVALLMQERVEEAIENLCQAWRNRDNLSDNGASLTNLFEYLGKEPEECQ